MNTMTPFTLRLSFAQGLFDRGDFREAALALADLVEEIEGGTSETAATTAEDHVLHGTDDLRLLLARAYFHSAQLGRAEATLNRITAESPTDGYAHLLLGRTLQRAGRHDEAARPLALAEILGDYERPQAYAAPARHEAG
ncbi:tetratricopeptide repeat protein [Humibacillus xanthopallidus]|nr:tetratricopeptide repeat protein [Humibacillus xanthopallidus]